MGIGAGIGGSFGIGGETGYGQSPAFTVDRFFEIEKVDLKRNKRTVQGGGLSGGNLVDRGGRRVQPTQDANGSVELEVTQNGWGFLLHHLTGTGVNVTGTGTVKTQTYGISDPRGESFTAQVGVPQLDGTIRPYTYTGCKIPSAEFTCDVDGLLMASIELDAKTVTETPAYVTPTYPATQKPFHGGQLTVMIGAASTNAGAASVSGIKSVALKVERPMANERFYAGGLGLKAEPVTNGKVKLTGSLDVDFIDKAIFADRFRDDSPFYMSLKWNASTGEGFVVDMPYVVLDTDAPTLDNEDVVNTKISYTALFDGTNNPAVFGYYSTDAIA